MFVRHKHVAREKVLVAHKHRNCVCATGAQKRCKFINRSSLANFGRKIKIIDKTAFILDTHSHKNHKLLALYALLHNVWYKSQTKKTNNNFFQLIPTYCCTHSPFNQFFYH